MTTKTMTCSKPNIFSSLPVSEIYSERIPQTELADKKIGFVLRGLYDETLEYLASVSYAGNGTPVWAAMGYEDAAAFVNDTENTVYCELTFDLNTMKPTATLMVETSDLEKHGYEACLSEEDNDIIKEQYDEHLSRIVEANLTFVAMLDVLGCRLESTKELTKGKKISPENPDNFPCAIIKTNENESGETIIFCENNAKSIVKLLSQHIKREFTDDLINHLKKAEIIREKCDLSGVELVRLGEQLKRGASEQIDFYYNNKFDFDVQHLLSSEETLSHNVNVDYIISQSLAPYTEGEATNYSQKEATL